MFEHTYTNAQAMREALSGDRTVIVPTDGRVPAFIGTIVAIDDDRGSIDIHGHYVGAEGRTTLNYGSASGDLGDAVSQLTIV